MASHSPTIISIFSVLIITSSLMLSTEAITEDCGIAIHWGRLDHSLRDLCSSQTGTHNTYSYVFAYDVNLTYFACSSLSQQFIPIDLSADVRYCQSQGIKVLVSLTGGTGYDELLPEQLALVLWKAFINGTYPLPQFQDSHFDGFDLAVTYGEEAYYLALVMALKSYSTTERPVHLSASPDCAFPSPLMQSSIESGLLDYVWPNFYNNTNCDYTGGGIDGVVSAWNKWNISLKTTGTRLFLGLPASPEAVQSGFIPATVLDYNILPRIIYNSHYDGVKLWDWSYDNATHYGKTIRPPVCEYTYARLGGKEKLIMSQIV